MSKNSAFFKSSKDPAELLAAQERQRLSLLKGLSRTIKEVQVMFANHEIEGSSGEPCIEDCRAAQRLCAQFEAILRHGLKPGWFGQVSTFWPVVLKISRKQAIQYIKGLQYAQTDNGRCRAWIRLAVNECSLESYINVLCQDHSVLSHYYDGYSFLKNHEMVTALTQLLVGLTQLTFKLTVDTASLEFEAAPEAFNNVQPALKLKGTHKKQSGKGIGKPRMDPSLVSTANEENGFGSLTSDETSVGRGSSESSETSPTHTKHTSQENETNQLADEIKGSAPLSQITEQTQNPFEEEHFASLFSDDPVPVEHETNEQDIGEKESTQTNIDNSTLPLEQEMINERQIDEFQTDDDSSAGLSLEGAVDESLATRVSPTDDALEDDKDFRESRVDCALESEIDEDPVDNGSINLGNETIEHGTEEIEHENQSIETWNGDMEHRNESVEPENEPEPPPDHDIVSHTPTLSTDNPTNSHTGDSISSTSDLAHPTNTNPFAPSEPTVYPEQTTVETLWSDIPNEELPGEVQNVDHTNLFTQDDDDRRVSVLSRDTIVDEGSTCSSEKGVWSSRESTPRRKGTNPFLDSDEEEVDYRLRQVTNPFGSEVPHSHPTSSQATPTNAHNRPLSFQIPPPPSRLPSNPFIEDITEDATPLCENQPGTISNHGNRPHPNTISLQPQSDIDSLTVSMDTPTIDKHLPSLDQFTCNSPDGSQNSSDQFLNQYDQPSAETTPSISPLSFLTDYKDRTLSDDVDTESYASSQDLSVILEGEWEQMPYPLGSPTHLSPTEDHFTAELSVTELQAEVIRLKTELTEAIESGEEAGKGNLRRRIVSMQLRLQQIRDAEGESLVDSSYQEVSGHRFAKQPRQTKLNVTLPTCEGCGKYVRGLIRQWYMCKICNCASHKGCIRKITRRCNQATKTQQDMTYTLAVCPERGLTKQKFRCGSCSQAFNGPNAGARLCDYTGLYHCKLCHHDDETVIPARVVHNWDFKTRKVCCRCSDILSRLFNLAVIRVKEVNPHLYTHVQDLNTVEALRKDLLVMRKYFMQCRAAREAQLLQRLNQLLHFKNSARKYSLSDLVAVQDGSLLPRLQEAHRDFVTHIKEECTVCSGKGYVCEMCSSEEILFPFDRLTRQCDKCKTVFHKSCFSEMTTCPRCARHEERHK